MVALVVMLFPPLLIAFLLVMERVEEPLRRPPSSREVEEFLGTASAVPWVAGGSAVAAVAPATPRWSSSPVRGSRSPTDRVIARTGP